MYFLVFLDAFGKKNVSFLIQYKCTVHFVAFFVVFVGQVNTRGGSTLSVDE